MALLNRGGGGRDRLSDLPDGVIGHVLSFLPTKEAARAAALARSWRHKFAYVDAISFVEHVAHYGPSDDDDYTFFVESVERRSKNGPLLDNINAALLCRRRCAGDLNAAPRAFRVQFGCYDNWDKAMVSQWLTHLLRRTPPELHLDLRLQLTVIGEYQVGAHHKADDGCTTHSPYDADPFTLPTRLFSCAALRTLCLAGCALNPPEVIHLPLLDTLLLSSINGQDCSTSIQRLISCCPRLLDLTLERCGYTTPYLGGSYTITVLDKHLRRLSLRCCHNLVKVTVDASELREFEYRGAVPAEAFLSLQGARNISSCHILGFCGDSVHGRDSPRLIRMFLEQFTGTRHLHMVSTHLGSDMGFTLFPSLTKLELTGCLHPTSVEAMTRILERAPSIQILSLFMYPHEIKDDLTVPDVLIPCLRDRLKEINLVHYQGHEAQRCMAKLLLSNAIVLERLCVVFPRGPRELQIRLKNEIKEWVVNRSAETVFL